MNFSLAAALLSVFAVQAADPAPAPAPIPGAPAEKKVCRSELPTGSMFAKRVCHSKAEWAQIDGQNQRDAEHFNDRRAQTGPTGR